MIEKGHTSGGELYVSSPDNIIEILSELAEVPGRLIKTGEKKEYARAREIASILMHDGLDMSFIATGNFLGGRTGSGVRSQIKRGMRRLRSDEEFAHTFAAVEQRSNIAKMGG